MNRRNFIKTTGLSATAALVGAQTARADENVQNATDLSRIAINCATLLHYNLPLEKQLQLVSEAGFQNVEIWFRDVQAWLRSGKSLEELRKMLDNLHLQVVGGIGFASWGSDDENTRRRALDEMKTNMEWMSVLGCSTFAASPAGIHQATNIPLSALADRYRAVLEAGESFGVFPQLELWGPGSTLSKLSDLIWISTSVAHPRAALLLDVYHLFRGGNDFESLRQLNGKIMTNFHWNDYPGDIPREKLSDGDRVFPGDGAAPFGFIRQILREIGFSGTFSLEIFNRSYCEKYEPKELCMISYEKMTRAI